MVVGMRPEGRGSVNWRQRVRRIVRACVGDAIVIVLLYDSGRDCVVMLSVAESVLSGWSFMVYKVRDMLS